VTNVTKSRRRGPSWPLADAKAHLSEVVERAGRDGPQELTRHGKPAAVVVSIDEWRRLATPRTPLVAFLREGLADLDLVRDSDPGRDVDL
jgi:prevent-host-death family protein